MREISGRSAAFVVVLALCAAGCDTNGVTMIGSVTGPRSITPPVVTVQPSTIVPRLVSDPLCLAAPPFLGFVNVTMGSGGELFLERIRFTFLDRFGRRAFPSATPIPTIHSSIPASSPVAIPGLVPLNSALMLPGHSRTESVSLRFDCGVPAAGTLFVIVEATDRRGTAEASRTSVNVGG